MNIKLELPTLYVSMPHECGYLPDHVATILFVDPKAPVSALRYSAMAKSGFRRSGNLVYRPQCETCHECVAVRIPVATFAPNRSQRRVRARNQDLIITKVAAEYTDEHFALYRMYQQVRHTHSSMDSDDPDQYNSFLFGRVATTEVYEFRLEVAGSKKQLLAVAIIDKLDDGLSAVYTFFDPSESRRALGVYTVLYEIELARTLGLSYVYLGYYIAESRKMNYKINYQPTEGFDGKDWKILNR